MAARVLRWVRRFAQVADGGYTSPKLKKLENPNVGAYLVTSEPIARSEVIFEVDLKVEGRVLPEPNTYSVQVEEEKHLDLEKVPDDRGGLARLLSHLNDPTVTPIISDKVTFRAVRDLEPGEELGFNYCTTEWSMASPFECAKGGQSIQGFRHLDPDIQELLKKEGLIASHIQRLAAKMSSE